MPLTDVPVFTVYTDEALPLWQYRFDKIKGGRIEERGDRMIYKGKQEIGQAYMRRIFTDVDGDFYLLYVVRPKPNQGRSPHHLLTSTSGRDGGVMPDMPHC